MQNNRDILVTSALPYANGSIHLGHLLEYIQTDIWVRFQKSRGNNCLYFCADDAHGTAIMLRAEKEGITPDELIERIRNEHRRDFASFNIDFDNYYSTHSPENRVLSEEFYNRLDDKGFIVKRDVVQLYDVKKGLFLADRFVKGTCPQCGAKDQYGDNCEVCSATYNPTDLIDPYSVYSGTKPELRTSEHYFFDLPKFEDFLQQWLKDDRVQPQILNKLQEWFEVGLQDWDISRDAPYFGFKIPNSENKYFYVWLDAPIGYLASFQNFIEQQKPELGIKFDDFWSKDSKAEVYHFIGKDIVYFHALFWPAMLEGAGFRLPTKVNCHGFVTVNGAKMSKSRGTFIQAADYIKHLNPEFLRYYFASKLTSNIDDLDLNLDDFTQKVNSDLVGKLVNIASRCAGFITKLGGVLSAELSNLELLQEFQSKADFIANAFEEREYAKAVREIMRLADEANAWINSAEPWVLMKQADKQAEVLSICSTGVNLYRILIIYLAPVLPELAKASAEFLNMEKTEWRLAQELLVNQPIKPFKALIKRVEKSSIDALIAEGVETAKAEAQIQASQETKASAIQVSKAEQQKQADTGTDAEFIDIQDFAKIDLRVGQILSAQLVEGSDKLLKFSVDLGKGDIRQIFSGIAEVYRPDELTNTKCIVVANLKPRKMRFGVSEGMLLTTEGEAGLFLLQPNPKAQVGDKLA